MHIHRRQKPSPSHNCYGLTASSTVGVKDPPVSVRHSTAQQTPVPMYIGLMVHAQTRKRELVDRLSHLGVSITYDRVLHLSAQLGETVIQQYHKERVVCLPSMRGGVFTTAAVDNIDHNPSSTTSKQSFYGTGISLFQHPAFSGQGVDHSIAIVGGSARQKTVCHFPSFYTEVPPVDSTTKAPIPPSTVATLSRKNSNQNTEGEYCWLENVQKILAFASDDRENSVNQMWTTCPGLHTTQVNSLLGKKSSAQMPYSPCYRRVPTRWQ